MPSDDAVKGLDDDLLDRSDRPSEAPVKMGSFRNVCVLRPVGRPDAICGGEFQRDMLIPTWRRAA